MPNELYYGDNLDVLRRYFKDDSVDLCYIDPPFNSKRNYNQIYNNTGSEDRAQAQAFVDTWTWDAQAIAGFQQILSNDRGAFTSQTVELVKGLHKVLGEGSLLAYLVSMTLRVVEIQRVLKPTGSFYLHCDPTASHYLKLVLDSVFVPRGGEFQNEIVWGYSIGGKSKTRFGRKHDVILFYTKSKDDSHTFNGKAAAIPRKPNSHMKVGRDADGREYQEKVDRKSGKTYRYYLDEGKSPEDYWVDIETLNREDKERLGYPTQKPEALLERIIRASSNEGDIVLDAYCGCGTTVAVAQRLNRVWKGIDITYQSIALILKRLEEQFGQAVAQSVVLTGIPSDMRSAEALAHKKDDRLRKEFEKWAVLTFTNNRAIVNDKKGGDQGIDGRAYFLTGPNDNGKIVFQVKSGSVGRGDVSKLNNDRARDGAEMAILITLRPPTRGMQDEARATGIYHHPLMDKDYPCVQIVSVQDIVEHQRRLDIPMAVEVLKKAQASVAVEQPTLFDGDENSA
ncbi:MAG TPA: DNA methyltransferase [Chloroflexia bacterium]|jgi:site-specific DNA-methyltransferase (adenine-specific)